jgi:hypothetical protein
MDTPRTPVTPVDLLAARPYADDAAFGDASLARSEERAPALIDRYLRSPLLFWSSQALLFAPLGLFLLQGLAEELGRKGVARDINMLLFDVLFGAGRHTIVGDILPVLVLPAVGILLALARVRDAKPGLDRKATLWMAVAALGGLGIVFGYAFLENFGRFLR